MKKYQELIEKIIFNFNDALELFNNKATKYASLSRLEKTKSHKECAKQFVCKHEPSESNLICKQISNWIYY